MNPLELVYFAAMRRRRTRNLARRATETTPIPVISVGNLSVGGTGKTPTVQYLARTLGEKGRVAVVSRGYGGSLGDRITLVGENSSAHEVGDEPLLHARALPNALVVAGRDRHHGVDLAAQNGARIAVLDDGFQFWSLPRTFDLVLLDARAPFGNGKLLPSGRLREEPTALERADAILLTRADRATNEERENSRAQITKYTSAPIWEATHAPLDLRDEKTGEVLPLDWLRGRRINTMSALADNNQFVASLQNIGADVYDRVECSDHFHWDEESCRDACTDARDMAAQAIVTTEKDAVKMNLDWFDHPLLSLRIGLQVLNDETALWQEICRKLDAS